MKDALSGLGDSMLVCLLARGWTIDDDGLWVHPQYHKRHLRDIFLFELERSMLESVLQQDSGILYFAYISPLSEENEKNVMKALVESMNLTMNEAKNLFYKSENVTATRADIQRIRSSFARFEVVGVQVSLKEKPAL